MFAKINTFLNDLIWGLFQDLASMITHQCRRLSGILMEIEPATRFKKVDENHILIEFELWNNKEMTSHALKSFIKELRHKIPVNVIKNIPQESYTLQY